MPQSHHLTVWIEVEESAVGNCTFVCSTFLTTSSLKGLLNNRHYSSWVNEKVTENTHLPLMCVKIIHDNACTLVIKLYRFSIFFRYKWWWKNRNQLCLFYSPQLSWFFCKYRPLSCKLHDWSYTMPSPFSLEKRCRSLCWQIWPQSCAHVALAWETFSIIYRMSLTYLRGARRATTHLLHLILIYTIITQFLLSGMSVVTSHLALQTHTVARNTLDICVLPLPFKNLFNPRVSNESLSLSDLNMNHFFSMASIFY